MEKYWLEKGGRGIYITERNGIKHGAPSGIAYSRTALGSQQNNHVTHDF
jgi:hypothetical protein